ncbi:MAG: ribosome biogenesis factor YjgA [Pseudomonadales bacterium]|jgi:ribosome-associated protein
MTELDSTIVSKSQEKREAEAVSQLAEQLCQLKRKQLDRLPYPNLVDAIMTYQKITKGNARKRQLGFISRQLRRLDLDVIKTLIQRFDSSTPQHQQLISQLEHYRSRLIASDPLVIDELSAHFPSIDRQHLRSLVRRAQKEIEAVEEATSSEREGEPLISPEDSFRSKPAGKDLFAYLKSLADEHLISLATLESDAL